MLYMYIVNLKIKIYLYISDPQIHVMYL